MARWFRLLTFGLGRSRARGAPGERIAALLGRLAGAAPGERVRVLLPEIQRCVDAESDFRKRIPLIDSLREAAEPAIGELEAEIAATPLPLPVMTMAQAVACDNLLKQLAGEYQGVVTALASSRSFARSPDLANAVLQAARLLARRQWLAIIAGKSTSRTAWRQLHRLHRLARDAGFAQANAGDGSIDELYARTFLAELAGASRFPRQDLAALRDAVRLLAPLVRLTDLRADSGRHPGGVLALCARDPLPGRVDPGEPGIHPAWQVHLDAVSGRLGESLRDGNAADGDRPPLPPRVAGRLLERIRRQPIRRFTRHGVRPRVDVITGMDHLWWTLSGPGLSRRRPGDLSIAPQDGCEWAIVDESPDGYGLKLVRGSAPEIEVGDIVGVGLRDVGRMHVCVVRRIDRDAIDRRRIGVQTLAPDAAAIVVLASGPSRQEAAILLNRLPAHGGRPGLVVAAGRLRPGNAVRVVDHDSGSALQIRSQIEDNGRFELLLLEPESAN